MVKINPVEEYFKETGNENKRFTEVFEVNESDVDIKTELDEEKITQITTLYETDLFLLETLGIKPIFYSYYQKYMRLLISKDRKSRSEYVEVNKSKDLEVEKGISAFNTLMKR